MPSLDIQVKRLGLRVSNSIDISRKFAALVIVNLTRYNLKSDRVNLDDAPASLAYRARPAILTPGV